jgi:hypothetical protein
MCTVKNKPDFTYDTMSYPIRKQGFIKYSMSTQMKFDYLFI